MTSSAIAARSHGVGWRKPSRSASGETGSTVPAATTATMLSASRRLGRLRQNGMVRVRITKITSVCVASDSTNQPA